MIYKKKNALRLLSVATIGTLFWYCVVSRDPAVSIMQEIIELRNENVSQYTTMPDTTTSQTQTTTRSETSTTSTSASQHTTTTTSSTAKPTIFTSFVCACTSMLSGPKFTANFTGECSVRLTAAFPAVSCEMLKSLSFNISPNVSSSDLNDFASRAVQHDCQPQKFTFSCKSLSQSSLNCSQPLVVDGFDYVKQHHCLSSIAHQADYESRLDNSCNGNGNFNYNGNGTCNDSSQAKVPRIMQYVWYYDSNKNFDIAFYLGMISTLRYFRPKVIFLWHDGVLPKGRWWQELLKQLHPPQDDVANGKDNVSIPWRNATRNIHFFKQTKLYFVNRQRPTHIYGNLMMHDAHKSDIVRLEALIHYGGLYIDTDVLAVRSLDTFLQYSVTMPKEPNNAISNSIIFAERDATYLYLWHHTYTSFRSTEWGEHSTSGNYNLYIACPSYLHIEPDKLLKPSNNTLLYVDDVVLTTKYLFHLYLNWEPMYAPQGSFRKAKEPEEILDWYCTMGRIMRSIFFGACDEFCG